jgi:hypothetical protein
MFAKTIIDSDAFVDMPLSTQALYFHLSMRADDDGFINNPKRIQRMIGCADDDLKLLIAKRFILPFDSGVVVIKHWKIHNYIQKDRYKETVYKDEKAQLMLKENGAYTELDTPCIQPVSKVETQVSKGKSKSIDSLEVVEVSAMTDNGSSTDVENSTEKIEAVGGKLGKGVVYLTQEQMEDLMDKLGLDGFNRYMEKLADFIIEKNANVKNHYATILKWWREDAKMEE